MPGSDTDALLVWASLIKAVAYREPCAFEPRDSCPVPLGDKPAVLPQSCLSGAGISHDELLGTFPYVCSFRFKLLPASAAQMLWTEEAEF